MAWSALSYLFSQRFNVAFVGLLALFCRQTFLAYCSGIFGCRLSGCSLMSYPGQLKKLGKIRKNLS